jgi:hypothetical protein
MALQLEDIEEKVLGVVHLCGGTAGAVLQAVYEFYLDKKPYENEAVLCHHAWAISMTCDDFNRLLWNLHGNRDPN